MMVKEKSPQEKYDYLINRAIPESLVDLKSTSYDDVVFTKMMLYVEYRRLAVLEWHLHKDVEKYKSHLKTALQYERERFIEVHQKNPSILYQCSGGYTDTALLTGDFDYAQAYATFIDNHLHPKPDAPEPWGYYVKMYLLLGHYEDVLEINMAKLKKSYDRKMYEKIRPHYGMYEALVEKDASKFHTHLEQLAKTHKGTGNLFGDYEDKLLCLKGLAFSNLALGRGMKIDFDHPFVPRALQGV